MALKNVAKADIARSLCQFADGGLMAYGPDSITPWRRAAIYVDRILKGEKPADPPVQGPTKYELQPQDRQSTRARRAAFATGSRRQNHRMKPKHPARPADDARQHARAWRSEPDSCLNDACRHTALIDVSKYPADAEVPSFGRRAVYGKCGSKRFDVRPNWKEQPARA
jgi:hypothetical protein